ncbi:MAG: DUF3883 domain-containing protein [Longimicrobiales bacterium]
MAGTDWTQPEVAATVRFYLDMLDLEISGESFNKAQRNRDLRKLLDDRSHGAVERKHQNISAILIEWGLPYVDGYKPLGNYQSLLATELDIQLRSRPDLEASLRAAVLDEDLGSSPEPLSFDEILRRLVDPPTPTRNPRHLVREPSWRDARVRRVNYLELEAANRSLGRAGEDFVVTFETVRLAASGREDLASRIEHTSVERGDGAGFDILSFEESGEERLIEVKTTQFGGHTPFYVTRNEVRVSNDERDRYHLYRVHKFRESPRLFTLLGALDETCALEATSYLGRIS